MRNLTGPDDYESTTPITTQAISDRQPAEAQVQFRTIEIIRETRYGRTDAGRGQRLADYLLAVNTYRFTPWKKHDSIWDETAGVWRDDVSGEIRGITAKIAKWDTDDDRASDLRHINAAVVMARGIHPALTANRDRFNSHPYLLAHPNATTTDLCTGIVRPSEPADLLTTVTAVAPKAGAAPAFEAALAYATYDDVQLQQFIWEMFGFCLPGTLPVEKAFFLWGPGGTGKSSLLGVFTRLLGHDAVAALPSDSLTGRIKDDNMADTIGKRVVLSEEMAKGSRLDGVAFKRIVSRGLQHGRALYQDAANFEMSATLLVSLNYSLDLSEEGVSRRAYVVPMTRIIPVKMYDSNIDAKFEAEGPQILARAIAECARLAQRNFALSPCAAVDQITQQWVQKQDALETFANSQLLFIENGRVARKDLNEAWVQYCFMEESMRPWNIGAMIGALIERGHKLNIVTVKGSRKVAGVTLLERFSGEYTPAAIKLLREVGDPRGFETAETGTVSMHATYSEW